MHRSWEGGKAKESLFKVRAALHSPARISPHVLVQDVGSFGRGPARGENAAAFERHFVLGARAKELLHRNNR
jgi:hypothetical protein